MKRSVPHGVKGWVRVAGVCALMLLIPVRGKAGIGARRSKVERGSLIPGMPTLRGPEALLPKTMPNPGLTIAPGLLNQFAESRITSQQQGALQPMAATPVVTGGNEVVSDGSLGNGAVTYTNGTYSIPSSVGTQVGGNLFESFSAFSLSSGEIADFENTPGVQNILARVTGGSASSINGTLESDTQGANLFLINPAGVMFGPNASLNLNGAFTVSTADYVKFSDGGIFHSSLGNNDVLSAAPVSAFGFTSSAPAPVSFFGAPLQVPPETGLSVIAGDVSLDSPTGDQTTAGSVLYAPAGGLTIVSVATTGELEWNSGGNLETSFTSFGAVSLNDGSGVGINSLQGGGQITVIGGLVSMAGSSVIQSIDTGGSTGGGIELTANALSIASGAQIASVTEGAGNAGNLSLNIAGLLQLSGGGSIFSLTTSTGRGAEGTISAGAVNINGSAASSGISNIAFQSDAGGQAGSLSLSVAGLLELTSGGEITANIYAAGEGGNLTIQAGSLDVNGSATPSVFTGIGARSEAGATGNAGNISVMVTGAITMEGAGTISSSTLGSGNSGKVLVDAGTLNIDGSATPTLFTGIGADSLAGSSGAAGNVEVNVAGTLELSGGGEISASTYDSAPGGDVTVRANSLDINGIAAPAEFTGIGALTESGATGNGGQVSVTVADALTIEACGQISSSSNGSGNAGSVSVSAGSLSINASALPTTSLTGIGSNAGVIGNGGSIIVSVTGAMSVQDGGQISCSAVGLGSAGKISVQAGSLDVDDAGIRASSNYGVTGGDVEISVDGDVTLNDGGQIASSELLGNGDSGSVTVDARAISIDGDPSGIFSNNGDGNGGDIVVNLKGKLTIEGGGVISSASLGVGTGGTINIHAGSALISGASEVSTPSAIYAGAYISGEGGNAGDVDITVTRGLTVRDGGDISSLTADGSEGGEVRIEAGMLTISGISPDQSFPSEIGAGTLPNSTGPGGDLSIVVAGPLSVSNGGAISASTHGSGPGGRVAVEAGSISIFGGVPSFHTGIFSSSQVAGGGPGGTVHVSSAGSITLEAGGEISSATFGTGHGGNVTVSAMTVSVSGVGSGIFAASNAAGPGGSAGTVSVLASGGLALEEGGRISSSSAGSGDGGDVTVNAGSVFVSDAGSGILAESESQGDGGAAGNVVVDSAGMVSIQQEGRVSSASLGRGFGGAVTVSAGSVIVSGAGGGILAESESQGDGGAAGNVVVSSVGMVSIQQGGQVSSASLGSGLGGSVNLAVGALSLSNGVVVSCDSARNSAGAIAVQAQTGITIENHAVITASAGENGGNIAITAGGELYLQGSSIVATAGSIKAPLGHAGAGGNISIDPEFVILDHGLISANDVAGGEGDIYIAPTILLENESEIFATGVVTSPGPSLALNSALVALSNALVAPSVRIEESCATALQGDVSSFVIEGSGDISTDPDESQLETAVGEDQTQEHRSPH